jgi:hypothetical protein
MLGLDLMSMPGPGPMSMLGLDPMSMAVAGFHTGNPAQGLVQILVCGQLRTMPVVQKSILVLSSRTGLLVHGSLLLADDGGWSQAHHSRPVRPLDDLEAEDREGCPWSGFLRVRNHAVALCLS